MSYYGCFMITVSKHKEAGLPKLGNRRHYRDQQGNLVFFVRGHSDQIGRKYKDFNIS